MWVKVRNVKLKMRKEKMELEIFNYEMTNVKFKWKLLNVFMELINFKFDWRDFFNNKISHSVLTTILLLIDC